MRTQMDFEALRKSNKQSLERNRAELTQRMATMPLPDPVEKWKAEMTEAENNRRAERAEIRRRWDVRRERERSKALSPPPGPDAGTIEWMIRNAILRERSFMVEVIGQSIGTELEKDVGAVRKEMAHRDKVLKAEREAHRREIAAMQRELAVTREAHARDLATLSRDIAAVARSIDQLGTTITGKKMDELREGLATEFARLHAGLKTH